MRFFKIAFRLAVALVVTAIPTLLFFLLVLRAPLLVVSIAMFFSMTLFAIEHIGTSTIIVAINNLDIFIHFIILLGYAYGFIASVKSCLNNPVFAIFHFIIFDGDYHFAGFIYNAPFAIDANTDKSF